MANVIFDLSFTRWYAILPALIPALLNVGVLLYVLFLLPRNRLTYIFSWFILVLIVWQLLDVLIRMSKTVETATFWNDLLWGAPLLALPLGVHFTLLYTERKVINKHPVLLVLLYMPSIFFEIINRNGLNIHPMVSHPFFGYVVLPENTFISKLELGFLAFLANLMLVLLVGNTIKVWKYEERRYQALLITLGIAIPVIQGTLTEVVLPVVFNLPALPLLSTSLCVFSVLTLIALSKYRLFRFNPEIAAWQIVETINDGLCVVDKYGKVIFVNPSFTRITGCKKEDILYKDFGTSLFDQGSLEQYEELNARRIKGDSSLYTIELQLKDKVDKWVFLSCSSIRESTYEIAGCLIVITDITKRKEIEEKLKEKNRELNTFFYKASHDLKGPLASVLGLTTLAESTVADITEAKKYFGMIKDCTLRLDRILKELIDITAISQRTPEIEKVAVCEAVTTTLEGFSNHPNFNKITINLACPEELLCMTDRKMLKTVLKNIIENSYTYYNGNIATPFIEISIVAISEGIRIDISDNGIGIDEQYHSRLFDMFFRGHDGSKGSGLGLYTAKKAIEQMGGNITLRSKPKMGTTFSIYLPNLN